MAKRLVAAALAAIFLGALVSCGNASTGSGASGSASAPASVPAASSPSGTPGASPTSVPGSPSVSVPPHGGPTGTGTNPAGGALTLTGTVEQGVEPGCLIMRSDGRTYELVSSDPAVRAGAQVVVTGHLLTGMMSHCQQGQMFQVTSVRQR